MKNNFQVEYNDVNRDECITISTNYVPKVGESIILSDILGMNDFIHKDIEKKVLSVKHIIKSREDFQDRNKDNYDEKFIVEVEFLQETILPYPHNSHEKIANYNNSG